MAASDGNGATAANDSRGGRLERRGGAAPHGGWEYPAFWAVTLVVQALVGAGAFALGGARGAAGRAA
ncbi:DoxX family protein [Burkholderia pseudomallei]|nr:DoxX family protein [Burkholderia pseudomallei]